jgi:hypothetical protein
VSGIRDPSQTSGVLDQHVLTAASRADQRHATLSRRSDDGVGSVWIAVRAARADDDCGPRKYEFFDIANRVGGRDPDVDGRPRVFRGMAEGRDGRCMVAVVGRQVDQNRYDEVVHQRTLAPTGEMKRRPRTEGKLCRRARAALAVGTPYETRPGEGAVRLPGRFANTADRRGRGR